MVARQLVLSGLLLLSGIAPLCAMDADVATENDSSDMSLDMTSPEGSGSMESDGFGEVSLSPAGEDASVQVDSISMESEQPVPMKKKMTPMVEEDMAISMDHSVGQNSDVPADQESLSEISKIDMPTADEYQSSVMEDKVDNQGQADVQGVFESMSREEEDESFPG